MSTAFLVQADSVAVAISSVAFRTVVVGDTTVLDIALAVELVTDLRSLPSGLTTNTVRQPLGINSVGDAGLPLYRLEAKGGRNETLPYLVNYTANSSLIWVAQGAILSTPVHYGAVPDDSTNATAAFETAAAASPLLVHPGWDPGDKFNLSTAPDMGNSTFMSFMADALSGAGADDLNLVNYLELVKGRWGGHAGHPEHRNVPLDIRFGVLRYFADWDGMGNPGWNWINDATHAPCGFYMREDPDAPSDNFDIISGLLNLSYTTDSSKNGTLLATPDETFALWNMTVGGSVGVSHCRLRATVDRPISANTTWNGSAWVHSTVSGLGAPTPLSETYSSGSGNLSITTTHFNAHPTLMPRQNGGTLPLIPILTAVSTDDFTVSFMEWDGTDYTGAESTRMNFFWNRRRTGSVNWDGSDDDDVIFEGTSNIWVLACHFGPVPESDPGGGGGMPL
jgi:hypothetical protein